MGGPGAAGGPLPAAIAITRAGAAVLIRGTALTVACVLITDKVLTGDLVLTGAIPGSTETLGTVILAATLPRRTPVVLGPSVVLGRPVGLRPPVVLRTGVVLGAHIVLASRPCAATTKRRRATSTIRVGAVTDATPSVPSACPTVSRGPEDAYREQGRCRSGPKEHSPMTSRRSHLPASSHGISGPLPLIHSAEIRAT